MAIPTFFDFYNTWFLQMSPQWRRLHRQGVADIFRVHLLPRLGRLHLDKIDRDRVMWLRAELTLAPDYRGRTLSASRINKILRLFSQMMDEAALRHGFNSPSKNLKSLREIKPDLQPFTLQEVQRLAAAIRPDFRDYLVVRCFTGMRTGEVNGLRWDNVDFERNVIKVRAIYSAGKFEMGGKSASAHRDIPMLPQVRQALQERHAQRMPKVPWVFPSPNGKPIDAHNFANRIWYPLLERLGLAKRRPYQTRHTAATLFLAAGESPEWIARVLGHANTEMLFNVYSSYVPNATRQDGTAIASVLSNAFGTSLGPTGQMPQTFAYVRPQPGA